MLGCVALLCATIKHLYKALHEPKRKEFILLYGTANTKWCSVPCVYTWLLYVSYLICMQLFTRHTKGMQSNEVWQIWCWRERQ